MSFAKFDNSKQSITHLLARSLTHLLTTQFSCDVCIFPVEYC